MGCLTIVTSQSCGFGGISGQAISIADTQNNPTNHIRSYDSRSHDSCRISDMHPCLAPTMSFTQTKFAIIPHMEEVDLNALCYFTMDIGDKNYKPKANQFMADIYGPVLNRVEQLLLVGMDESVEKNIFWIHLDLSPEPGCLLNLEFKPGKSSETIAKKVSQHMPIMWSMA
jgi:hypothetical protein